MDGPLYKTEEEIKSSWERKQDKLSMTKILVQSTLYTGCLNTLCQTSNHLLGIKNTLLSHKNGICTFMRCGNLTYDTWIWLKVTSLSSTASVLNECKKIYAKESLNVHNVKILSIFFPTFLACLCLFTENESLHLAYWVISLASGASAASMTSTASMTSVASMTSTASFHQKTYWAWCCQLPGNKMTCPGLSMWNESSKIHYFMDFCHFFCWRLWRP